ncbi:glutamate--tRNA ligase [bacterium]|mgnify:FL=1|nr:glutamate--tRNA ligase [bacterium]MBT6831772.1 glutamate--tRNA ligase [bacterium]MBT6996595.1 glutamate--tRNA ligase [bacterium]MBT7772921.1 glutamate--tRNA ligase [bacterium]
MNAENSKPVVVRMPPSPTGHLHLGTARAALFNWLFAHHHHGKIIFRWEDTDLDRSDAKFEREIFDGLAWLGMDFENECELFRQTENAALHREKLGKLWDAGKVFPCFTTTEKLDELRKLAAEKKENFVFWSPDRDLEKREAEEKMKTEKFVWRLRTPRDRWIVFKDLVRKKISVNTDTIGDFAVARSDGSVLYFLANAIDDATQGVTHVLRGEDHVSNTPKQILLYEALGENPPEFGHIPLVLDHAKRKLSKRNVDPGICVLVKDFQAAGFIPEGVVNGLVFLGWNPKSTEEIFSMDNLVEKFEIGNVNPGAAQYDFEKMLWFNAQWMRRVEVGKLQKYFEKFSGKKIELPAIELAREKAKTLVELDDELKYLIGDPGWSAEILEHEKMGITIESGKKMLKIILELLEKISVENWSAEKIREISVEKIAALGVKNGEFMWPFRVALSNRKGSAGPFEIAEVLGKTETMNRLARAAK